jgi:hypothetical protein
MEVSIKFNKDLSYIEIEKIISDFNEFSIKCISKDGDNNMIWTLQCPIADENQKKSLAKKISEIINAESYLIEFREAEPSLYDVLAPLLPEILSKFIPRPDQ